MTDRAGDERLMDEALALAARGRGATSPNPMVGAVVVSSSAEVVGRGHHERAGAPHAEIVALAEAGAAADGGTLYCSLEPCDHVGRTGPCTARILEVGIRRVVVAMVDPDPRVRGAGIARLRRHGLEVEVGVRGAEAARLNRAFVTRVTRGRPFVTMKIALSRDGMVAAAPGERTRLTSAAADRAVHETRAIVDAVGVGSGTVLVDDPVLTARGVTRARPLLRVIFDRRLRTPTTARMLATIDSGPVVIVTTTRSVVREPHRVDALRRSGAEVEAVVDGTMEAALRRLAERGVTWIVIEGGVTVHRAIWRAELVDHVQRFTTPVELGPGGVRWIGDELDPDALVERRDVAYGPDVSMEGYVQRAD